MNFSLSPSKTRPIVFSQPPSNSTQKLLTTTVFSHNRQNSTHRSSPHFTVSPNFPSPPFPPTVTLHHCSLEGGKSTRKGSA